MLSTARINERLIPAIRESQRSDLLGVASRTQAKAHEYAAESGIPRAYGSYEEMLADPEIDAIYISLPNSLHEDWSIKCARAGKHVLCEKPLALTADAVDRMAAAALQSGVVLQEAAMYRYHPQARMLQELVAVGSIGELRLIQSLFTFTLKDLEDVRFDPSLGGGSLWDLGSYQVSFARFVTRANPVEVAAWQVSSDRGVDLTFVGQMRFPSGVVAQFSCSFQSAAHWNLELIGSTGRISLDIPWTHRPADTSHVHLYGESAAATAVFSDAALDLVETFEFAGRSAYHFEIEAMEAAVLDNAAPVISLNDSRDNVATLEALYAAARDGCVMKC
jgi:xylose dehydrogenase (NAD/NADP)